MKNSAVAENASPSAACFVVASLPNKKLRGIKPARNQTGFMLSPVRYIAFGQLR